MESAATGSVRSKQSCLPKHQTALRASIAPTQIKARQISHLHAQIAQLEAHLVDLDNHLHVTSIQAEALRRLGGLQGGLFMAASRVLGEQTSNNEFSERIHPQSSKSDSINPVSNSSKLERVESKTS